MKYPLRQSYNFYTDVLTVLLEDTPASIAEETPSGIIVHYAMPSHQPVGLTILDYYEQFGGDKRVIEIDTNSPFSVQVYGATSIAATPLFDGIPLKKRQHHEYVKEALPPEPSFDDKD